MRRATWLVAIGAALALTSVQSASAESLTNSQQEKMKECNADATTKSLSGDERKAFMKTCLSKKGVKLSNSQQQRMKDCNAEATTKSLSGDSRKAFMKTCLSAGSATH
jgi:hypothetical protein